MQASSSASFHLQEEEAWGEGYIPCGLVPGCILKEKHRGICVFPFVERGGRVRTKRMKVDEEPEDLTANAVRKMPRVGRSPLCLQMRSRNLSPFR